MLGGVELPELYLEGEVADQPHKAESYITVDGEEIVFSQRQYEGRKLNLIAEPDIWITQGQVDQLKALVEANEVMELQYGTETYTVRFRIEDPPVLELEKVIPYMEREDLKYYGTIKLKEV